MHFFKKLLIFLCSLIAPIHAMQQQQEPFCKTIIISDKQIIQSDTCIDGKKNTIVYQFEPNGCIEIAEHTNLILKNTIIKGIRSDSFKFQDPTTSKLFIRGNVEWNLALSQIDEKQNTDPTGATLFLQAKNLLINPHSLLLITLPCYHGLIIFKSQKHNQFFEIYNWEISFINNNSRGSKPLSSFAGWQDK